MEETVMVKNAQIQVAGPALKVEEMGQIESSSQEVKFS